MRRRVAGLPYDSSNASIDVGTATAEEVVAEKGWKLAGELGKCWWDLVRTETLKQVIVHRDPTEENSLAIDVAEIDWRHYIAPIPSQAMIASEMTQNPEGFIIK